MKSITVSIAEGKKGFSGLIRNTVENKEEIVVTKRGKAVAVIVPYDEYMHSRRLEGYRKIMEARDTFLKSGIQAGEVYKESRDELEGKL